MRARAGLIRLLLAPFALLLFASTVHAQSAPEYKPGEVLVKFRDSTSPALVQTITTDLGSDRIESFPKLGVERLRVTGGTVEAAVARLKSDPNVVFAEPNYIYHANTLPNDPGFPQLWGLRNTGQTGGTPGDDIHAPQAWSTFTGSGSVLVGVIDTGADYLHPDLAANMYVNPGEIAGNGIDDDHNGFIDDVHGWDFANNDNDPMDDHFHGTHVSGTIGAVGNNGIGVAGVNWTVSILPIKFLDAGGSGSADAAIHAIDYATMMGVKVINASWGGGGYSEALRLSIAAAGDAGVLFVAAAGNNGADTDIYPNYPSSYDLDNIVAVAATDANDQLAYFSNFGLNSVDLAAPGVDIYSTMPGGSYGILSGTSMATPHVVGVAALIRGRFPGATPAITKALLLQRAEPRPGLAGRILTGARLDALMSLSDPDSTPPSSVTDLTAADPNGGRVTLNWSAPGDDGTSGTAFSYDVRYSTAPINALNFDAATKADGAPTPLPYGSAQQMIVKGLAFNTTYHFALKALDDFGNSGVVSNDASSTTLGPPDIAVAPDTLSAALKTGETADQVLTVSNHGVSDLEFTVKREGPGSGVAIDVLTGGARTPETVLARGHVVPLASLASARGLIAPSVRVGDSDPPDKLGVIRPGSITPGPIVHAPNEEVFGNASNLFEAPMRTRGNIFQCTTARTLHEHRLYLSPLQATQLWFLVYEGTAAAGTYTLVSASNVSPAGPGTGWYSSGDIDLPMIPGRFYLVVASFEQVSDYFNQLGISPYPIPASFGSLIGGAGWFWGPPTQFPPAGLQEVPPDAFGDAVAYYQTLVTDDQFTWVSASPDTASVPAGGQLDLVIHIDAAGLNDGDYDSHLVFESNDPDEPALRVGAHLHVTGAPDIAVTPSAIDFGPLFIGATRPDSVTVRNTGTRDLNVGSVSTGAPQFAVLPGGFTLAPGAARKLEIRFAPSAPGPITGMLTFASDDPDEPAATVALAGVGLIPPDVAVSPDSLSADLLTGDHATRTITVANTGGSDLTFNVSIVGAPPGAALPVGALASIVITPPESGPGPGNGVALRSDKAPVDWAPRSAVHAQTAGAQVLLVEDFRPWGSPANSAILTDEGIAFDAIGSNQLAAINLATYRVLIVSSDQPQFTYLNLLARAAQIDAFVTQGGTLEFHGAGWGYGGGDPSILTLPGGARVENYYASTNYVLLPLHPTMEGVPNPFTGTSASHGFFTNVPGGAAVITSDDLGRPTLIEYAHGAGRVLAAGQTLEFGYSNGQAAGTILRNLIPYAVRGGATWLSAAPVLGTVPAGGSATITVQFDATGLLGGDYGAAVRVASNDPDETTVDVPAHLHVTGVPRIAVLGQPHELVSTATYAYPGATTQHSFNVPTDQPTEGSLRLDVNGDYNDFGETATVMVEGLTLGHVGQRGYECSPDSGTFALTDAQLAQVASDDQVQVSIVNSSMVEAYCPDNRHTVRLRYRDPGQLAFGLRLLGSCQGETLEVRNAGTDTLEVGSIVSSSPRFVVGGSGFHLGPGASEFVGVTFCPIATGEIAATLALTCNDPTAPTVTVAMTGGGAIAPDIAVTPASLDVEMESNHTLTRTFTIANTGGPLVWSAIATSPHAAAVIATSPVFAGGSVVPKDRSGLFAARDAGRDYTAAPAPPAALGLPQPLPGPPPGGTSLESLLARLDATFGAVTSVIPGRYDFDEGVTGNLIGDGGGDMYDGGNLLQTNLGGPIDYSDGLVRSNSALGPQGRYFTRKYPGLFVFAADLDGVSTFNIDGNLGADGSGSVDGAIFDVVLGGNSRTFVKRVFAAGDPSVNHMVIVPNGGDATHSFAVNTDDDHHSITGLHGGRIYYLLYSAWGGGYIDNPATQNILAAFLAAANVGGGSITVSPASGGAPSGSSVPVTVTFDSQSMFGGDYDAQVLVASNDPDENPVVIPAHMHVIGIPEIEVAPDSIAFGELFVGGSKSDTVVVRNIGTTQLNVTAVSSTDAQFTVDPSPFALAPGGTRTLLVSFHPAAALPAGGTVNFASDDPAHPVFPVVVTGMGLVPPDILVTPDSLSADVPLGERVIRTLTIQNTGGSPLSFELAAVQGMPADSARIGIAAPAGPVPGSAQPPPGYQPAASAIRTTSGAKVLLIQDYLPWFSPANNQVLADNGIAFDVISASQIASTNLGAYRDVIVAGDQPTFAYQWITARAAQINTYVENGGRLEFHAAGWGWNSGDPSNVTLPGGVHIAFYLSYTNFVLMPGHPLVALVPNPIYFPGGVSLAHFTNVPQNAERIVRDDAGEPNLIVYHYGAGTVVAAGQALEYSWAYNASAGQILRNMIPYDAAGGVSWLSADPGSGQVPPGGSAVINVTFDATSVIGGDFRAALEVDSNDPDENPLFVPVHMRALGIPNISVVPASLDFGPVFIGASRVDSVVVRNVGSGFLTVAGVTASPGVFAADSSGFVLNPGDRRALAVFYSPGPVGPSTGTLTIASDDPDTPLATVALAGEGIVPPDIVVSPDSLSASLAPGGQTTRTLTLQNSGGSPLKYDVWITSEFADSGLALMPRPPADAERAARSDHPPIDYRPAAVAPRTMAGAHVLLVQDSAPWGSEANNSVLDANGIAYDIIGTGQLPATDLTAYRDVIVAGDQSTATYQAIAARAAQFDGFVTEGGTLEFHAAGWGFANGNPTVVTLPGGMHIVNSYSGLNDILLNSHPIVAGVPDPFTGSLASHAAFTNIPPGASLIVRDDQGIPNLVSYRHGLGRVVASGQTLERGFSYGESAGLILRNLIPYDAFGSVSWLAAQPRSGTIAVSAQLAVTLTFDATGLAGGDYHAVIEIDSNDPAHSVVNVPAHLTVTGGASSLVSVETGTPRFQLAPVAPTPARGAATIAFELTRPGNARLTIFDVAGRQVREMASGPHGAGRHVLTWHGEDDHGARRGAGIYLLRLETAEGQRTRRMVWAP